MNAFELKLDNDRDIWRFLSENKKGIEREILRVDQFGRISQKPHPMSLGSALAHPYITTDYSEALLELVTPPLISSDELESYLLNIHYYIYTNLEDEILWSSSMPFLHEKNQQIPLAFYGVSAEGKYKTTYRKGLAMRYGELMQAISGVHFNFSFSDNFLSAYLGEPLGSKQFQEKSSNLYMHLARNYQRFSFFLVYLFGASPCVSKNYKDGMKDELTDFDIDTWIAKDSTSLRMSDIGYNNFSRSQIYCSLNSLDSYVEDLRYALTTKSENFSTQKKDERQGIYSQLNDNLLQIENEYYANVRPKADVSSGHRPIKALKENGVSYIEIRSIDLNPFSPIGIDKGQMHLIEMFLICCALWKSDPIGEGEHDEIYARDLLIAKKGRKKNLELPFLEKKVKLDDVMNSIFDSLEKVTTVMDNKAYETSLRSWRQKFNQRKTISYEFIDQLSESKLSFQDFILALSASHQDTMLNQFKPDALTQDRLRTLVGQSLSSQKKKEMESVSFETYLSDSFYKD
jgi:glutamate--cysteine ligase